jgi:hypothetical protein
MVAKLTRLTHKIAIQLHLVAESCTILQFFLQVASPETFGYNLVSPRYASYPMGTRVSFLGGKAAGSEADHSPPSSAEVKE